MYVCLQCYYVVMYVWNVRMYVYLDGWMEGWMSWWLDGCLDGWMDIFMYVCTYIYMYSNCTGSIVKIGRPLYVLLDCNVQIWRVAPSLFAQVTHLANAVGVPLEPRMRRSRTNLPHPFQKEATADNPSLQGVWNIPFGFWWPTLESQDQLASEWVRIWLDLLLSGEFSWGLCAAIREM